MNTIKGAVWVLSLEAAFWLLPPDHDPAFMALPWRLQAIVILGCVAFAAAGLILFVHTAMSEKKP